MKHLILIFLLAFSISIFSQNNDTIALEENQKTVKLSSKITDCEDVTLQNVNVVNLTSGEENLSDGNGNYTISVRKNEVLLFSLNGFISQKVVFENQKEINISLKVKQRPHEMMVKKPVIYLYPTHKTNIHLVLDFKGQLLTTFPKYENNWQVTAYPDGRIFDKKTNRFYNSLFWDGNIIFPEGHYDYKSGFVVSKKDLTSFLIQKLENIGLNTTETNDFVQYWLPILEKNEFNFIHFRVNNDYDVISKNNITPKPDTSIRVFMDFYALDKPKIIPEQILRKTERKGFTLVEWGGSDVSNAMKSNL
ncbi:hypothetical protein SAMN05660845_0238 [Flavobacterium swingsii]|uniref:CarboxypepD_reg-like domain-containing protein n=1 Tax=Flavobacterium swingsii TaxID=498292 RepID=A0A1I0V8V1_9FLAO|nr:hypothetical protein [Flavobacterium swingsii]SFA72473.1 hypothetical protein SAMN05660845_0238 [Flavobacterium swingsii]